MRFLRGLARVIFALTFIVSGFLKLIDPVGTGLIVGEYLSWLHLDFLSFAQIGLGIALSTIEFAIGISILIGLRMRFFTTLGLCFISLFTILTLFLAILNPISDCGCFGRAIHLSNWASFGKNVFLFLLAIFIFFGRNKSTRIASPTLQWVFVGVFSLFAICLAVDALLNNPRMDYTAYSIGTDFNELAEGELPDFVTVFTYEKDGEQDVFTIDNLPDSTWNFVESKTIQTSGSIRRAQLDFMPDTLSGVYFAVSAYKPSALDGGQWKKLKSFKEQMESRHGVKVVIYSPEGGEGISKADWKSLITLNRSNGGITCFSDGVLVGKWPFRKIDRIDYDKMEEMDPDEAVIDQQVRETLFVNVVFFSILFILALIRYFCRILSKSK